MSCTRRARRACRGHVDDLEGPLLLYEYSLTRSTKDGNGSTGLIDRPAAPGQKRSSEADVKLGVPRGRQRV
jgi:hypothetical protein